MHGITEQKIRAYFLGDMTADDAFAFEVETAASAELTDFVRVVETALVDDFVAGRLSKNAAGKFKLNYLTTPVRLDRCRLAAGLLQMIGEHAPPPPVAPPIGNWFEQNVMSRKKFVTFLVGLCLLIAIGLIAAGFVTTPPEPLDVVVHDVDPQPLPAIDNVPEPEDSGETETTVAVVTPNRLKKTVETKSIAEKTAESKPANDVTARQKRRSTAVKNKRSIVVKLLPGMVGNAVTQAVTIAPDVDRVLVLLSPGGDPNRYSDLHAILKTPENTTVYSSERLNSLSFSIDAARLENRTYVVTLEGKNGQNRFERIANYTFVIRR